MAETARIAPVGYLNTGALVWFVGFLVYFTHPSTLSVRASGYVYGALALVGGVFIGTGLARLDVPFPKPR
jgi:hypothetical protein